MGYLSFGDKEEFFSEKPKKNDLRRQFERDRARIIHSTAFRRLQGKAQVFQAHESDFFRTRLTHSLEVAQIGKAIGRDIEGEPDFIDLVEAVCLAHDIGNPPFGHPAETVLNLKMKEFGGYEGNAQGFRLLTKLEKKSDEYDGLNLSFGVLDGILKYKEAMTKSRIRQAMKDGSKAKGYYIEDKPSFNKIVTATGTGKSKSLACRIMDLADDIAYSVHDIEDGLKAGLLSFSKKPLIDDQTMKVMKKDKHLRELGKVKIEKILERVARKWSKYQKKDPGSARKMLTSDLISEFICHLNRRYVEDHGDIEPPKPVRQKIQVLKIWARELVFNDWRVRTIEKKGERIIKDLFKILAEDGNGWTLMPEDSQNMYLIALNQSGKKGGARVICDFIAGMTDNYAMRYYARLVYPSNERDFIHSLL